MPNSMTRSERKESYSLNAFVSYGKSRLENWWISMISESSKIYMKMIMETDLVNLVKDHISRLLRQNIWKNKKNRLVQLVINKRKLPQRPRSYWNNTTKSLITLVTIMPQYYAKRNKENNYWSHTLSWLIIQMIINIKSKIRRRCDNSF